MLLTENRPVAALPFTPSPLLTLGVEVEVQLVDWRSYELCPAAPRLIRATQNPQIKPEYLQTMLEISTGVCHDLQAVREDLQQAARQVVGGADDLGVEIVGAGTHPFSSRGTEELIYPDDRYQKLMETTRWVGRRLICGLHVHVGASSGDHAITLINGVSPYLAHLLALSASSPFQAGLDTEMASSRVTVFESQPTAGTPPGFRTWQDFEAMCARLVRAEAITSIKDLWWDIRPSPTYGTVEVRICDGLPSLRETLAVVAAIQCLFAWVHQRAEKGEEMAPTPGWRLRENKWRASRWGLEARLVVSDHGETRPVRDDWERLLEELTPIARKLGSYEHLQAVRGLLANPSYQRQRDLFQRSKSLRIVTQELAREWRDGLFEPV